MTILIIFLITIYGVLGDYLIKLSTLSSKNLYLLGIVFLMWGSQAFTWYYVFKRMKLIDIAIAYSVSGSIMLALVGMIFFQEKITIKEIIGLIMAFISLFLLTK